MLHLEIGSCNQLTPAIYAKFLSMGITNTVQFITQDLEELSVKSQVPFRDLLAIRRYLIAKHACVPVTGAELYEHILRSSSILSTGYEDINRLLDGGLYSGEITELSGLNASGKTQICLKTTLEVCAETQKEVVYFDASGTQFNATKLVDMMKSSGRPEQDPESFLRRIKAVQIFDIFQLFAELHELKLEFESSHRCIKLLVIDSLTDIFRCHAPADILPHMMHLSFTLKSMSTDFSFAVLCTTSTSERFLAPAVIRPNVLLNVKKISSVMQQEKDESKSLETALQHWAVTISQSSRLACDETVRVQLY